MRKRNHELKVRMTDKEIDHLNKLVVQSKLSRESYLRMLINGLVPRASPSEELIDTILILRNISNSIYQLSINNPDTVQYQSDFELLQEQINQIMILIRQPIDITKWVLEISHNKINFFFVTLQNVNYISNDSINDLWLEILKTIKEYLGISAPKITLQIQKYDSSITLYKIKNEIRRNLGEYVEHVGAKKTGGYYLKSKDDK